MRKNVSVKSDCFFEYLLWMFRKLTITPFILFSGCFCDFGYVKSGDQCIEVSKCFSHCPLDNGFDLALNSEYISSDCGKKCICEPNYADSTLPPGTQSEFFQIESSRALARKSQILKDNFYFWI